MLSSSSQKLLKQTMVASGQEADKHGRRTFCAVLCKGQKQPVPGAQGPRPGSKPSGVNSGEFPPGGSQAPCKQPPDRSSPQAQPIRSGARANVARGAWEGRTQDLLNLTGKHISECGGTEGAWKCPQGLSVLMKFSQDANSSLHGLFLCQRTPS